MVQDMLRGESHDDIIGKTIVKVEYEPEPYTGIALHGLKIHLNDGGVIEIYGEYNEVSCEYVKEIKPPKTDES